MKAPGIGLLIGVSPKGKAEKEESSGDASMAAAEAVMAAFRDDDVPALNEALRLHYEACQMSADGGEYEDD